MQGFVAGEAVEAHDARVHVGAAAGGDDGFVPFGQAREELEQARAFVFGQGFQIVEDDQRLFARQREAQFVGTLIGREFFESVCAQFLAQFIQHGEVGRAGEVGQFGFAFGGQFAHFGGDENLALEEFRWRVVCGFDGERGLADAAGSVNQCAPGAGVGGEGGFDDGKFFGATEEEWKRGEGVACGFGRLVNWDLGIGFMVIGNVMTEGIGYFCSQIIGCGEVVANVVFLDAPLEIF